ncbi:hypothetical protein BGZ73_005286 [Actinomortierella ambigua]|nr:hypothetical protein BGZ73_005286 [Actinomortierella ambigua]
MTRALRQRRADGSAVTDLSASATPAPEHGPPDQDPGGASDQPHARQKKQKRAKASHPTGTDDWPTWALPCHSQEHGCHSARNQVLSTPELLANIVGYLHGHDLCRLALACQRWQGLFQPFIYEDILIVGPGKDAGTARKATLRQYNEPISSRAACPRGMDPEHLPKYCHLVTSIRFRGRHRDEDVLHILRYPLPRLRHIDLSTHEFESVRMLTAIVGKLSNVRSLVINGYSQSLKQDLSKRLYVLEAIQQHCTRLEVLKLGFDTERPTFLLAQLLQSMPSLRRLDFGDLQPTISTSKRDMNLSERRYFIFNQLVPQQILDKYNALPLPTWQNNTLEDLGFDIAFDLVQLNPVHPTGDRLPIWLRHLLLPLTNLRHARLLTWCILNIEDWAFMESRLTRLESLQLAMTYNPSQSRLAMAEAILASIQSKMTKLRALTLKHLPTMTRHSVFDHPSVSVVPRYKVEGSEFFRHLVHLQELKMNYFEVAEEVLLSLAAVAEAGLKQSPKVYPPLVSLDLQGCTHVTARGVRAILNVCEQLKRLNLLRTEACTLELFDGDTPWACTRTLQEAAFDIVRLQPEHHDDNEGTVEYGDDDDDDDYDDDDDDIDPFEDADPFDYDEIQDFDHLGFDDDEYIGQDELDDMLPGDDHEFYQLALGGLGTHPGLQDLQGGTEGQPNQQRPAKRALAEAYDTSALHTIRDRLLTLTSLRAIRLVGHHLDFEIFSRPDPAVPDSLLERVRFATVDMLMDPKFHQTEAASLGSGETLAQPGVKNVSGGTTLSSSTLSGLASTSTNTNANVDKDKDKGKPVKPLSIQGKLDAWKKVHASIRDVFVVLHYEKLYTSHAGATWTLDGRHPDADQNMSSLYNRLKVLRLKKLSKDGWIPALPDPTLP